MFVSNVLIPSHPEICDIVEQLTTCLNVFCCFIALKHSQAVVFLFIVLLVHAVGQLLMSYILF